MLFRVKNKKGGTSSGQFCCIFINADPWIYAESNRIGPTTASHAHAGGALQREGITATLKDMKRRKNGLEDSSAAEEF